MAGLKGQIERVTYHNEENAYSVLKVKVRSHKDLVTVTGNFVTITPGETLNLNGYWKNHPEYGQQFYSTSYESVKPATEHGIEKYLASSLIKGIGPVMAKRIVAKFKTETFNVIESNTENLSDVDGIGPKRVEMIKKAWDEQKDIRGVMIFLQGNGVSPAYAVKIYKHYGKDSIAIVSQNPYRLAMDIFGIGFLTADRIAENVNIPKDSQVRIVAGIIFVLSQLADEGHVYYPIEPLIDESMNILNVERNIVEIALEQLAKEKRVILEKTSFESDTTDKAVYLSQFHTAETGIAKKLKSLLDIPKNLRPINHDKAVEWVQDELLIVLADKQKLAVKESLVMKILVITGGPGTVLKDIIVSRSVPTVILTEIFRQAKESLIIVNAHRINNGEMPFLKNDENRQQDFYYIEEKEPDNILEKIIQLCRERIPDKFGYDSINDIQVLTPMNRGSLGTTNLNGVLQKELNKSTSELSRAGKILKTGDKVMQIKNNYDKEVFNGDIGKVLRIDTELKEVIIDFDGENVSYDYFELDEIVLAYAVSVHKSQGSEYPVLILPVVTQHYMLLQRNLLYTGITRGKKLVILIGTKKAIGIAVKNDKPHMRYSLLGKRLA